MRRRALLSVLGAATVGVVAIDWLRDSGPPVAMCVPDPANFYESELADFDRIGGDTGGFFAGAAPTIEHTRDVSADPVDELPDLPTAATLYPSWETDVITGAGQAHWPDERAAAWASFESTRAVLEVLGDRLDEHIGVRLRAATNPDGITSRTDVPADADVLADAVGLIVLQYPVQCIETEARDTPRVFVPDIAFPDLVAATPASVDVDVTMGEHQVTGIVPTVVYWYYTEGLVGSPPPI